MEPFDVSKKMMNARVWIKIAGLSEVQGTIQATTKPSASKDETEAVNSSLFFIRLDSGAEIEVPGSSFSRIDLEMKP